jgi:hypothetical protein
MTDLTTWQADYEAILSRLPDSKLADELKAHAARKLRESLATGDGPPFDLLSADAILTTIWPEPVWAIDGLLPAGLTILAGKPKVGKSWLALQIAQAVAAGGYALGQRVTPGPVLYLALEDPPRRLKERLQKQHWQPGTPADFMPIGQFADQVGDLRNGGGEKLARQIEARGYRLVVVDTLSRSCIGDQNDVQAMTAALTPIQEISHRYNCVALLVDHQNKLGSGDVVGDILGSTAKGAMADTIWGLYRERGKAGAKLTITGREVEERTIDLEMDWLSGAWQVNDGGITPQQRILLDTLKDTGPITVTDLAEVVNRNRGNVYKQLTDLQALGLVTKRDDNTWYILGNVGNEGNGET